MLVKNTSREAIESAISKVNEMFGGNVYAEDLRVVAERKTSAGKDFRLKLKVKGYDYPGWSRSIDTPFGNGRRSRYACWHVVGEFIDALPDGTGIVSGGMSGPRITVHNRSENWQNWQVGTPYIGYTDASDLCMCHETNEAVYYDRQWRDREVFGAA